MRASLYTASPDESEQHRDQTDKRLLIGALGTVCLLSRDALVCLG